MKKVLSLFLSVIMAFSTVFVCVPAYADSTPFMLKEVQQGFALCPTETYFTNTKDLSRAATKKNGSLMMVGRNRRFKVLGKEKKGGSLAYIRLYAKGKYYYGYIPKENVCIDNSQNYVSHTAVKYNPYYKKDMSYKYYIHNNMPYFQFDQTGQKDTINGLKIAYSCGPQSLAGALSALNGDIVFPEMLMKKMSKDAPNKRGTGSSVAKIASSTKKYVRDRYHLNYEYKVISPYDTYKYIQKGYMVILGVENRDSLALFTKWSHYILLVDYDEFGNIMVSNSNLQTHLLNSFSYARIRKNIRNQQFYYDNTLAIKYDYDDSYTAFDEEIPSEVLKDTYIYQHYGKMGKFRTANKGKKIKILGKRSSQYYVSYTYSGETAYGFIDSKCTNNTVLINCSNSDLIYSGKEQIPEIKLTNVLNEEIPEEDYEITYPESPVEVGTYKIKIKYTDSLIGKKSFEFRILPKQPIVYKINPKKTIISVKWKNPKDSENNKCRLEISESRNFKKILKSHTASSDEGTVTFRKLKKGKSYYIRAAAVTKNDGEKYYSPYTRVYCSKTKK